MNETNGTSNPSGTPVLVESPAATPQPPSPAVAAQQVADHTEANFSADLEKATQRKPTAS